MVYTKYLRMEAKEQYDRQLELHHRGQFSYKGTILTEFFNEMMAQSGSAAHHARGDEAQTSRRQWFR